MIYSHYLAIYGFYLYVSLNADKTMFKKFIKNNKIIKNTYNQFNRDSSNMNAKTHYDSENYEWAIIDFYNKLNLKIPEIHGLIAHEIHHVLNIIQEKINQYSDIKSDEFTAYLTGWLTASVYDSIFESRKN